MTDATYRFDFDLLDDLDAEEEMDAVGDWMRANNVVPGNVPTNGVVTFHDDGTFTVDVYLTRGGSKYLGEDGRPAKDTTTVPLLVPPPPFRSLVAIPAVSAGESIQRRLPMPSDPTPTEVTDEYGDHHENHLGVCNACDQDWPCAPVRLYARGVAEGRRQATEGWKRQWGFKHGDDSQPEPCGRCQGVLQGTLAAGRAPDSDTFSRLVGPWETAEQPEPAEEADHG